MEGKTAQHFYSEFLGTFALVFVGSAAIMVASQAEGDGLLKVAVAHGLILSIMVSAFMRVAAHFNPAVTIGFLFTRRIAPGLAGIHLVAQFVGAIAAAAALKFLMPDALYSGGFGGIQSVASGVTGANAWGLEFIATFFLMTAIYGTAVDSRAPKIGGFGIGLVVLCDILAIGPLTGASMNPARTIGPMLVYGDRHAMIIYATAPLVGAIVAALLYENFVLKPDPSPAISVEPPRS